MRKLFLAICSLICVALSAPLATAANYTLFGVLRPDANGNWYIQNDATHKPYGLSTTVTQTTDYIRIHFSGVATYTKAGSIQLSSDDDFNTRVEAFTNLGLSNATIRVYVDGVMINPADIWTALGYNNGGGNVWVTVQMSN